MLPLPLLCGGSVCTLLHSCGGLLLPLLPCLLLQRGLQRGSQL